MSNRKPIKRGLGAPIKSNIVSFKLITMVSTQRIGLIIWKKVRLYGIILITKFEDILIKYTVEVKSVKFVETKAMCFSSINAYNKNRKSSKGMFDNTKGLHQRKL